eukprot:12417331-Karenia_brevis.AAC.1
MEKTSKAEIDFNAMHHNALRYVEHRVSETLENSSLSSGKSRCSTSQPVKKRKKNHIDHTDDVSCSISIQEFFTSSARTDNILGVCSEFLSLVEQARVSMCAKTTFDCNVSNVGKWQRYVVSTGNVILDQFEPWYFGVAFAFVFKYCTGMPDMPDFSKTPRYLRSSEAPTVQFPLWVRIMTRRVEQQLRRDWLLGFTMSSVLFQSALNMARSLVAFESEERQDGSCGFNAQELESAAVEICNALHGSYADERNKKHKVNGDISKVLYVTGLSTAAHKILQRIRCITRKIPGTNE